MYRPAMPVRCTNCKTEYDADHEPYCPSCGSYSCSYRLEDAEAYDEARREAARGHRETFIR